MRRSSSVDRIACRVEKPEAVCAAVAAAVSCIAAAASCTIRRSSAADNLEAVCAAVAAADSIRSVAQCTVLPTPVLLLRGRRCVVLLC
jgi:hypothetical protein